MKARIASIFALAVLFVGFAIPEVQAMRWYSPSTGRWLSRDPIGEEAFFLIYTQNETTDDSEYLRTKTLNPLYRFCLNDPVDLYDPTGLIIPGDPDPTDEILIGAYLIRYARPALAAARTALRYAYGYCRNIRCKASFHVAHHPFPVIGKACHIQVTCWGKGVPSSQINIRIPVPCKPRSATSPPAPTPPGPTQISVNEY